MAVFGLDHRVGSCFKSRCFSIAALLQRQLSIARFTLSDIHAGMTPPERSFVFAPIDPTVLEDYQTTGLCQNPTDPFDLIDCQALDRGGLCPSPVQIQ